MSARLALLAATFAVGALAGYAAGVMRDDALCTDPTCPCQPKDQP